MDEALEFGRTGFGLLQPYPLLQALLIIIGFLLLATAVDRVFTSGVRRLVARTTTNLDDRLVEIMHRPIFMSVAAIGLVLATYRLDFGAELQNATVDFIQTILIVVWLLFGLRFARLVVAAMTRNERHFKFVQPATEPLLANAVAVLLLVAGVYSILIAWDINVTGLVASAGIVGLALSFAAQDTLSNLFAGMAILADRPYSIGDFIILDTGERGEVKHIGLRSTRLLTRDDVEISIPNGVMGSAKIINEAGGPTHRYRVRIGIGVAYGSDIDRVMTVLHEIANAHPLVQRTPEPRARFRVFGESSLDLELLCWIARPADRGLVVHELNCEIYKRFSDDGISIPFPQRDLHIKGMPQAT
ncbi:MAG: mechanosensitive ion channel family protein [Gammaproteobacteria bacterium]